MIDPTDVQCPNCNSDRVSPSRRNRWEKLSSSFTRAVYFRCKNCRHRFSVPGLQSPAVVPPVKRPASPRWLLVLMPALLLSAWVGFKYWQLQAALLAPVTAIAVIGGGVPREIAAAQLARDYPDLPVYVLGGEARECTDKIFGEWDVDLRRVVTDYRSRSTLTNLTTLLPYLRERPTRVAVVTDSGGWRRAQMLGTIILGNSGIAMAPALLRGEGSSRGESTEKIALEAVLATLWILLGDLVLPSGFLNTPLEARVLGKRPQPNCTSGYYDTYDVFYGG